MDFILCVIEAISAGFLGMLKALIKSIPDIYSLYSAFNKLSFGYLLCTAFSVPAVIISLIKFFKKCM